MRDRTRGVSELASDDPPPHGDLHAGDRATTRFPPPDGCDKHHSICSLLTLESNNEQIAWLIAFISQVLAKIANVPKFPNFSWFTIAFALVTIIGIAIIIAMGKVPKYQVAVSLPFRVEL